MPWVLNGLHFCNQRKRGDGEGVAGEWVRTDSRMVILGGDVGEVEEGKTCRNVPGMEPAV